MLQSTSYNADSTKSFMEAMAKMAEGLNQVSGSGIVELREPESDKTDELAEVKKNGVFNELMEKIQDIPVVSKQDVQEMFEEEDFNEAEGECQSAIEEIQAEIKEIEENDDGGIEDLYGRIIENLKSSDSDEAIQSVLFDLLGFESFDLISKLVQNRKELVEDHGSRAEKNPVDKPAKQFLTPKERDAMIKHNLELARNAKLLPSQYSASPKLYAHVFQESKGLAESIRLSMPRYEEITIPISEEGPRFKNSGTIEIKQLDQLCRGTFKGYKTLNRVQSLVYPVGYQTNENMLICAPTGAGKTDIAMLTVLNTIGQFSSVGESIEISYDDFKIVYIAPLKALAAEIVAKFSSKLSWLNVQVRELTGDMQLTKSEIFSTQIIVTTPEKWDVVTRKSNGDNELVAKVKLLIIDEVHLLHEDRGSVLETLVARTLRQVELSQLMIRVVGLSATLPNYVDVADFLGVNRQVGMFYFSQAYRPIPLKQQILGVRQKEGSRESKRDLDEVVYEKVVESLNNDEQVMVFVHSRKDTVNSARTFITMAQKYGDTAMFLGDTSSKPYSVFEKEVNQNHRSRDVRELFQSGFSCHHAGMLRSDRNLVERMFSAGVIKVLVCTATLAWGVNLPASTVIIKGTQIYDPKRGGFVDIGISDVIQIFGRAGRPQFEKFGTGILCTTANKLDHYFGLLSQQHPIESKFMKKIVDNLNAEISLGTVMSVDEGIRWLGYTYLFVRMRKNPFGYGLDWKDLQADPQLIQKRESMIVEAARRLHSLQMIVFDERSTAFISKDLGRIASEFYLLNDTIELFNRTLRPQASEADVLATISVSSEFDNISARQDESAELTHLLHDNTVCQVPGEPDTPQAKTNILLQAYVSKSSLKNTALISDSNYVAQNSARICRALLFIGINRRWGAFAIIMLNLCKSIDQQTWHFEHPFAQFELPQQILRLLNDKNPSVGYMKDMTAGELGDLVHNKGMGSKLARLASRFPLVNILAEIYPITNSVLRVRLTLEPDFVWDSKFHGGLQMFWVFVESSEGTDLLHHDKLLLNPRNFNNHLHQLDFMIPLQDPIPNQIVIRAINDRWIGADSAYVASFQHLIKPHNDTLVTRLLKLQPLPTSALHNPEIESIYNQKFNYFNAMQTMVFHSLYNQDTSAFIGSPTGSGKTIAAELALWRALYKYPGSKVVYIAPMKALVRERVDDWRSKICKNTKFKLVELTGDSSPDAREIQQASIIITTPEKFDGISRNWQTRTFVQKVSLVIMDEIHLLASDRGPILEMIVLRMNYISSVTSKPTRLLGMSTAVSNAMDMASWLGVKNAGLFNFPQSVRPVPLQMYIEGFPDNLNFGPLMKKMNKPAFNAIKQHSPTKPVLIFVASRRQTRLTALDLIHLCGLEENPKRFVRMDDEEIFRYTSKVKDETLKLSLQFGIGLHHAGLVESDRKISHQLFEQSKIQVLVATSTLAWGVNLPAHLVIIKGTQFFDAKIEGYKDMDLTDVLQMMGRAGRPAFDVSGIAIVYTKESTKTFYKYFLNVGFPVESSLHKVLDDHIGAEIAAGTITNPQNALEFLSWTFLFRRIYSNPTYYGVEDLTTEGVNKFLSDLISQTLDNLAQSSCLKIFSNLKFEATPFLEISSYYYISHRTVRNALQELKAPTVTFDTALKILSLAIEYDELPTRHGEELINSELSEQMRYKISDVFEDLPLWDPHVKTFLLFQAYMSRIDLPITDYIQDTNTVLDQALRIVQAMIDVAAELGKLQAVEMFILLLQCIKQGCWFDDDMVTALPGFQPSSKLQSGISLAELGAMSSGEIRKLPILKYNKDIRRLLSITSALPTGSVTLESADPQELQVTIAYQNESLPGFKAYCSKYLKLQKDGWFIIVADTKIQELYLIKRGAPRLQGKRGKVSVKFTVPDSLRGSSLSVICINDSLKIQYVQAHQF